MIFFFLSNILIPRNMNNHYNAYLRHLNIHTFFNTFLLNTVETKKNELYE